MINKNINIVELCKTTGQIETVSRVSSEWSQSDYAGSIKCRISNSFRMKYKIEPGLYAVGEPDANSEVFARSANYKLSFDVLRKALKGLSAWIKAALPIKIYAWNAAPAPLTANAGLS